MGLATVIDLTDLGELYHDYRLLGGRSHQRPGIFGPNQRCKEPIIGAYIQMAIAKSRRQMDDPVTFTELFCADGYYAMLARHFGASVSFGIDSDRDGHFGQAAMIAERLGLTNVEFLRQDVGGAAPLPRTDIVANVGGLYHVSNPVEILAKSYEMANKFLIVQTVYSLTTDSPEYFETPAPGWDWGCRFSLAWFEQQLRTLGYEVVDRHQNELEGNTRPEDRGSAYYLIRR